MRLDDLRDQPRAAGRLQRHHVIPAQAPREQLELLHRACDPAGRTHPAALRDRDLAEVAMHVHPDEPHRSLPPRLRHGKPAGEATTTDTCSQHTRAGRRGGHEQRRAHSPQFRRPAHRAPQEQPLSRDTDPAQDTGRPHPRSFIPGQRPLLQVGPLRRLHRPAPRADPHPHEDGRARPERRPRTRLRLS